MIREGQDTSLEEMIAERIAEKVADKVLARLPGPEANSRADEYLYPREAAKVARKAPETIYTAIKKGELKALSHGSRYLIRRSALDRWMDWMAGE